MALPFMKKKHNVNTTNDVHTKNPDTMTWLPIITAFLGWILFLAGLIAVQVSCGESNNVPVIGHYLTPTTLCRRVYRYAWWILAFELVALVLAAQALARRRVHDNRVGIIGVLAVVTVLIMDTVNTFLFVDQNSDGDLEKRAKVVCVGTIIIAISNLLLMLKMGKYNSIREPHNSGVDGVAMTGVHHDKRGAAPYNTTPAYGTGTTTNVGPAHTTYTNTAPAHGAGLATNV